MRTRANPNETTRNSGLVRNGLVGSLLGVLVTTLTSAMLPASARAEQPGAVLRSYLAARMQGDLATARKLWDSRDVRRAGAMGIQFTDIEAAYDDYWMLSAEERAARAALVTPSVMDSVVEDGHAFFTVELQSSEAAARDTLRYHLRQNGDAWSVSLPYQRATRAWTRREGRFVRLRAKRLVDVSTPGLAGMDAAIERALQQLKAPESAILRLERIKVEYYLCDTEDDVRMLLGSTRRQGYLPAGQRVVTVEQTNVNAVARALVHLALRKTPLHFAPLFEEGLAAALGGAGSVSGPVFVHRARNIAASDPEALEQPLDELDLDGENALAMAAVWSNVLLAQLEADDFAALLRDTGGTSSQVAKLDAKTLRDALGAATGKGRRAMTSDVQSYLDKLPMSLIPGCKQWPAEVRGLNPVLQWRDSAEDWGLMGYTVGDEYVFTVAAYVPGPPPWMRDLVDSLQAELTDNALEWAPPAKGANPVLAGDPPEIVMLVRAKLEEDVEPYESALFAEHFLERNFKNELFGLFVSHVDVRLYDYSQNKLVAEYTVEGDPEGGAAYYDEDKQRICFRFPFDLIPRNLTSYYVALQQYSGE